MCSFLVREKYKLNVKDILKHNDLDYQKKNVTSK